MDLIDCLFNKKRAMNSYRESPNLLATSLTQNTSQDMTWQSSNFSAEVIIWFCKGLVTFLKFRMANIYIVDSIYQQKNVGFLSKFPEFKIKNHSTFWQPHEHKINCKQWHDSHATSPIQSTWSIYHKSCSLSFFFLETHAVRLCPQFLSSRYNIGNAKR